MSDQRCGYTTELRYRKQYECKEPVLPNKFCCILHFKDENKDLKDFTDEVTCRIIKTASKKEIDLIGCYFPENFKGKYFEGRTFSKHVNLSNAIFTGEIDFSGAVFSKGATFYKAKFGQRATFRETSFEGQMTTFREAKFNDVGFHGTLFRGEEVSFSDTQFEGETDFDAPHFYGKVYFLKTKFSKSCVFRWIEIRTAQQPVFEDVDLSHCSFLHSNIDKVDFRYCTFAKKPERFLWFSLKPRQNVLKDELEADKKVEESLNKSDTRFFASLRMTKDEEKLRGERYKPVRRLYQELKCNFENKKDWNTAGDFHYGEMECRRKMMQNQWERHILFPKIVHNLYYASSGYGERPLRALTCTFGLVALCFLAYLLIDYWESFRDSKYLFDSSEVKSTSGYLAQWLWFSVETTFWWRFAEQAMWPISFCGHVVFLFGTILGPFMLALFILALRRKVKR